MTATAEILINLYTKLSKKYDRRIMDQVEEIFSGMSEEESRQLVQLCEQNPSPETMALIGTCYQTGKGVSEDDDIDNGVLAFEWFKRSADLGNPIAMFHLAKCYRDSDVEQDEHLAVKWYRRSAELGNPYAMYKLGRWYNRAQDAITRTNDNEASSDWFIDGRWDNNGQGERDDARHAFEWFKRSADLGHVESMDCLARCYRFGTGVEKNAALAIRWYQKAIDSTSDRWRNTSIQETFREMKDPHAYIRYYLQMYESRDSDPHRHIYRSNVVDELRSKDLFDFVRGWYRLEGEIGALKAENEALKAQNEQLKTEVTYQPGGAGFREAMSDFVSKASADTPDVPCPTRKIDPAMHSVVPYTLPGGHHDDRRGGHRRSPLTTRPEI